MNHQQRALSPALMRRRARAPVEKRPPGGPPRPRRPSPFASTAVDGLERWIEDWLADLAAREYRPRTLSTYGKALSRLAPTLAAGANAGALVSSLAQLKPATRSLYLNAARSFDKWCLSTERTDRLALGDQVTVKLDAASPRPLSAAAVASLDRASKDRAKKTGVRGDVRWRTRFLYLLLRETGIRIGEALALRWRDVVLEAGREGLRLRTTKGRADRFVPLMPGDLLTFLRRRAGAVGTDHPLLGTDDEPPRPWSYSAALRAWRLLCARAGVVAVPHQLRHTRATELVKMGASPNGLQRAMGWSKLEQATRYVKFDDDDLRAELRRLEEDKPRPPGPRRRKR